MKEGDGIALFRFERVRTEPIAVPVPHAQFIHPKEKRGKIIWQSKTYFNKRLCDIKLNLKNEEVKLLILIICKVIVTSELLDILFTFNFNEDFQSNLFNINK